MCLINICITNIYSLVPFASFFLVFGLGIFVLFKNFKGKLNLLYFFFSLAVGIWLFGTFMMFNVQTDELAIKWDRFIYIGVVFITTLMYHIGVVFTDNFLKKKYSIYFAYLSSLLFLIASRTDYFVSGLYKYHWGVHTKAQILHHPFLVFFYGYFIWFVLDLIKYYKRRAVNHKHEQTKYLLFGCLMLVLIGTPAYFPAYNISVPPYPFLSGVIFTIILAYAILKYHLMDIAIVVKRGTIFVILFSVLMIFCSFGMMYLTDIFSRFWAAFLCSLAIILGFGPFKSFLEKLTDKIFLRNRYKFDEALSESVSIISTRIEMESLIGGIEKKLGEVLKVNKVKVLVFGAGSDLEKIYLVSHLKKHKFEILDSAFLSFFIDHDVRHTSGEFKILKDDLDKINFQIAAPIFFHNKANGILFLGSKIDKNPYYLQDINFIKAVTNYLGAAIENAKLYEKADSLVQKLTIANKAKEDFIKVVSHQFRTPLSTMRWYGELINEKIETEKTKSPVFEEIYDFINIIYEKNLFLINILNFVFDVLAIEGEKFKLDKRKIFLWEILNETIEEFKKSAFKKGINIVFKKEEAYLGDIIGDSEQIKKVLKIVIDNAVNYSKSGGKIVAAINKVSRDKKEYCEIVIKDSGIGITKGDQEKIFTKFFRGENAMLATPDGLGLGLYIAKYIVEKHNGKIKFESEENKGTTFYVSLPLKQ